MKETKKLRIVLIDADDVPAEKFPFFISYKIFFDRQVKVYGFYENGELIAVTAIIPEDASFEEGFMSVGCPIIYVFEVREDLRGKGYGKKCAKLLVNNVISDDTIQLCCAPHVVPFWNKIGFKIQFIDQTLYMHKMILKKEDEKKKEKKEEKENEKYEK
ncbi:MAG: GNAT family N-acetyltransferase [Candidatus Heimdallarchaeaceae archaeon]